MGALIRRIEARGHAGGRTSAVRVFIVEYYRKGVAIPAEPAELTRPAMDVAAYAA